MCVYNFVLQPDFSDVPLNCDEDVDNWLNFYEMNAPLVCVGELVSHDPVRTSRHLTR